MTDLEEIPVVTSTSRSALNRRQLLDYRSEREACLKWLLTEGKNPEEGEGYAEGTVEPRSYRMENSTDSSGNWKTGIRPTLIMGMPMRGWNIWPDATLVLPTRRIARRLSRCCTSG